MSRNLRENIAYEMPYPVAPAPGMAGCACTSSSNLRDSAQLLYRPESAGELLDMRRSTVYELIRSGRLGSVKVGRARLIPRAALESFVSSLGEQGTGGHAA